GSHSWVPPQTETVIWLSPGRAEGKTWPPTLVLWANKLMGMQTTTSSNMASDSGPSRLDGVQNITEEEQGCVPNRPATYDVVETKLPGRLTADASRIEQNCLRCTKSMKIGTWNVRGMDLGKLQVVKNEMDQMKIDILGISELHWIGRGFFQSGDHTIYYSGNDTVRRNGVAFIISKKVSRSVKSKLLNTSILQVYAPTAPTSAIDETIIEEFYAEVQEAMDETPKKYIIYVIGDFNTKVGSHVESHVMGSCDFGEHKDRLVQFCHENQLWITNTGFKQPKRHLYTWLAPDGIHRNQIDYILCSQKRKNPVLIAKTFPEADCMTDHQLLVMKAKLRWDRIKWDIATPRFLVDKMSPLYAIEVKNRFDALTLKEQHPKSDQAKVNILWTCHASRFIIGKIYHAGTGTRRRCPRIRWLDTIQMDTGMRMSDLKEAVKD
uniref:Endonuclease/exonuclease/phosphatase domain-containing protein n=1 Tax=Sinocyclocheilus anshuiensis TaxID=1608454 RepID=A0A671PJN9_9TELE